LAGAYKTAFFVLQEQVYLRGGSYVSTRKALLDHLNAAERAVLEAGMNWDRLQSDRQAKPEHYFEMLLDWSSAALRGAGSH
jgi:hypothetical protein